MPRHGSISCAEASVDILSDNYTKPRAMKREQTTGRGKFRFSDFGKLPRRCLPEYVHAVSPVWPRVLH
eukprot:5838694-Prymnesium_polylepis.1